MCNLYANKATAQEIADIFRASAEAGLNVPEDVYPQYPGLVVRDDGGTRVVEQMTWGFPRHSVNKRTGKPNRPSATNNARDDKLWTIWRQWFTNPAHRCLIPFTAFAEAEGEKGKMTKSWICVADQPVAAWAGLWRSSDEWGACYTGVMVDATEELGDIHDRMPLILDPEDHACWLNGRAEDAMTLVRTYPADRLVVERSTDPWFQKRS